MKRMLIVDDEPFIVSGLYEFMMLESGLELDVYKAYSADEAIGWLQRTKMDIVVTDIRMPGMSGLKLLSWIKARWPYCKVILLTGHDAFDYVYEAIRYDGVRYLLKTEGYEAILEMVQGAIAEIDETHRMEDLIATADRQLKLALPLLHRELVYKLLRGERMTEERRVRRFEQLELPMDPRRELRLLLGRMELADNEGDDVDRDENGFRINLVLERYMGDKYAQAFLVWEDGTLVWLLQPATFESQPPSGTLLESLSNASDGTSSEASDESGEAFQLKGNLELALETCEETLGVTVHFLLDDRRVRWEEAADRLAALRKEIAGLSAIEGRGSIAGYADSASFMPKTRVHDVALLQVKKLDLLGNLLESGQRKPFFELLEEIVRSAEHAIAADQQHAALGVYYPLSLALLAHVHDWQMEDKLNSLRESDAKIVHNPSLAPDRAGEVLRQLAELLFDWRQSEKDSRVDSVILFLQQYVQEHLGEDLSLVVLAELSRLNPSYLSRLFKKATGINLNAYIQEARLGKAMELLRQPDYKVYEIAKLSGYEYAPYFTKIFRKALGMSPQRYRDLHAASSGPDDHR